MKLFFVVVFVTQSDEGSATKADCAKFGVIYSKIAFFLNPQSYLVYYSAPFSKPNNFIFRQVFKYLRPVTAPCPRDKEP